MCLNYLQTRRNATVSPFYTFRTRQSSFPTTGQQFPNPNFQRSLPLHDKPRVKTADHSFGWHVWHHVTLRFQLFAQRQKFRITAVHGPDTAGPDRFERFRGGGGRLHVSFLHPQPVDGVQFARVASSQPVSWKGKHRGENVSLDRTRPCIYTSNKNITIHVRIHSTVNVIQACIFILLSVLEVTQRVPPTCIIKTSRTDNRLSSWGGPWE